MQAPPQRPRAVRRSRRLGPTVLAAGVTILVLASLGPSAEGSAGRAGAGGWTRGHPWTGAAGIRESVRSIQAREARSRGSLREFGRLPEAVRHPKRQNPSAPRVAQWPPAPTGDSSTPSQPRATGGRSRAPQALGTSFTGATLADTNFSFPPDTMGAIGPTQYVVAVNGRIRSFNRSGVADGALDADTDVFFASVMTTGVGCNFTSDPRIRYDRLSGRWFLTIIDVPGCNGSKTNRVLLAVSSGSVITSSSSFTFFFFNNASVTPSVTKRFADYDTLGIDANALYIGDNAFSTATGHFLGTDAFVVRKSSVLGAGPIVVTAFRGLVGSATGAGPFTPQGVDDDDAEATVGYFIGVDNASFGQLDIRRVADPGGTPSLSGDVTLTVPTTSFPLTVPHLGNAGGTNGELDALDDRLFAARVENGHIWTAHNIAVTTGGVGTGAGTRDGVRWYEIQNVSATPSLVQSGTVFDGASSNPRWYWIPSIMVSGQGHSAIGSSAAGPAEHVNAATVGRLSGDALGTMRTPALYTSSGSAYNPPGDPGGQFGRRWGDYSYVSLDPLDDMTMWSIQQFVDATNSYGVRVVKLIAPPPATPSSASGSVPAGSSSTTVTITGTSSSGSGFYDPGPNLGGGAVPFHHLSATVSGGVTVNSATSNSPTSVTLDLNTTGAAPGTKDVTITNPDGQLATGAGILTVTSAPPASADLVLTKTHSSPVVIGTSFPFTISVSNGGPDAASDLQVTDTLPASMTFSSISNTGGASCSTPPAGSTGTVTCTKSSLGSGGSFTVTLTVRPTRSGSFDNTASVSSSTAEAVPGDESDTDSVAVQTNAKGCTIIGTGGNDTITGTSGPDVICGRAGADTINGAGAADTLYGQGGNDALTDHAGTDKLVGGGGADALDTADGAAGDTAIGGRGTDTCSTDPGDTVKSCE